MATYFVDPYKKYYDKLNASTSIVESSLKLAQFASEASTILNRLQTRITSATWDELGYQELKNTAIPLFIKRAELFKTNIDSSVVKASSIAINELLKLLSDLKSKDESYESVVSKIDNAGFLEDISSYRKERKSLESEISTLKFSINQKVDEIKVLNSQVVDFAGADASGVIEEVKGLELTAEESTKYNSIAAALTSSGVAIVTGSTPVSGEGILTVGGITFSAIAKEKSSSSGDVGEISTVITGDGNTVTWNVLDGTWTVVNTKFDVASYAKHVAKYNISQTNKDGNYNDLCLAFSYIHASNLITGQSSDRASTSKSYKHAGEFTDFKNDNKNTVLQKIYYEVMNGNPVIMQVNGNKQGTSRHFVTVLGFKNDVTSAESLTEDDLLIMDSYDGKVERMDTSSSRFMITGADAGKNYSGYYLRVVKS